MLPQGEGRGPLQFCDGGGGCGLAGLGCLADRAGEGLVFLRSHGAIKAGLFASHVAPLLLMGRGSRCLLFELDVRTVGSLVQGGKDTVVDAVEDRLFREEFHLGLGRVDVHVHGGGREPQVQDAGREFAYHDLVAVGFLQRRDHDLGADRSVVDEEGLQIPTGTGVGGLGYIAGQGIALPAAVHRDHFGTFSAIDAVYRRFQSAGTGGGEGLFAVPEEGEGYLWMGQCLKLDCRRDPAGFHGVGLHEFHSGRGVEEQVPDDDGGAVGTAGLGLFGDSPGLQMEAHAGERSCGLGQQVDPADGADRRQCFSAEAHGGDGCQIFGRAELAGGVTKEGGPGILGRHATAIVGDTEEGHAAVTDLYRDLGSTGIHRVLQQFFDYAGRTLHHLACGDEVGDMGR